MKPGYLLIALALGALIILSLTYREALLTQCQHVLPALCGAPPEPEVLPAAAPVVPPAPMTDDDQVPATPPIQSIETEPPPAPPEYVADDATLRVELARLDPPASWLELDDLRQRLATLLVSLADGSVPRKLLGPIRPAAAPSAIPQSGGPGEEKFLLVENGSERFGPVVDVALSLPPAAAAQLLERLTPALSEELVQLGDRRDLDALLDQILAELEAVPAVEGALVRRPGLRYVYDDPALEAMNDLRKTALRLGPELRARIIAYGRAVQAERARLRGGAAESGSEP